MGGYDIFEMFFLQLFSKWNAIKIDTILHKEISFTKTAFTKGKLRGQKLSDELYLLCFVNKFFKRNGLDQNPRCRSNPLLLHIPLCIQSAKYMALLPLYVLAGSSLADL